MLLPLIERSQKKFILNFSTGLASIGLNHEPKAATYSISKAGVNMLVCSIWHEGVFQDNYLHVAIVDSQTSKNQAGTNRHRRRPGLGQDRSEPTIQLVERAADVLGVEQ